jgi:hypothetical protein
VVVPKLDFNHRKSTIKFIRCNNHLYIRPMNFIINHY